MEVVKLIIMRLATSIPGPAGRSSINVGVMPLGVCQEVDEEHQLVLEASSPSSGWMALCIALTIPVPTPFTGVEMARVVKEYMGCTIVDILQGKTDFLVPRMVLIVESAVHSVEGVWTLRLRDFSGPSITGVLQTSVAKKHEAEGILNAGSAIALHKISVLLCPTNNTRSLNIHEVCVLAVFPGNRTKTPAAKDDRTESFYGDPTDRIAYSLY